MSARANKNKFAQRVQSFEAPVFEASEPLIGSESQLGGECSPDEQFLEFVQVDTNRQTNCNAGSGKSINSLM